MWVSAFCIWYLSDGLRCGHAFIATAFFHTQWETARSDRFPRRIYYKRMIVGCDHFVFLLLWLFVLNICLIENNNNLYLFSKPDPNEHFTTNNAIFTMVKALANSRSMTLRSLKLTNPPINCCLKHYCNHGNDCCQVFRNTKVFQYLYEGETYVCTMKCR